MSIPDIGDRLSRIETVWSELREAHDQGDDANRARQALMQRYCGAVYRYVLVAVRDPNVADDLTQEFALRFVKGYFAGANPERGRFRDYVKTSLFHLVEDYRKKQKPMARLDTDYRSDIAGPQEDSDACFLDSWRKELLAKTWAALEEDEKEGSQPYYTVLQLQIEKPELRSTELAREAEARTGKPCSADNFRKLVQRARQRFGDLMLREVSRSLGNPSEAELEQELADLNLLKYCEGALERRAR